jgi:hypothetical protein
MIKKQDSAHLATAWNILLPTSVSRSLRGVIASESWYTAKTTVPCSASCCPRR